MIELNNITIVCIDCYRKSEAIIAIRKTLEQTKPKSVLFFTDVELKVKDVEVVKIPSITSKNEYSHFIIKELYKYIETEFVLIIQWDGFVLDYKQWDEKFLEYDYIGASWLYPSTERNVGNGGFSLRSLKLLTVLGTDNFIEVTEQEDDAICRLYGSYLENQYDIKFAPIELANKFSFELNKPLCHTFGFHGFFHQPFKDHIVLKRTASMGDVIMLEPIMEYYHNKGYQVVLDTLPKFFELFKNHYYPVIHTSQLDHRIKPIRTINFDMAYEINPKQLVLQSYIDVTGDKDIPLRNSKLVSIVDSSAKFFDKYILIHIDETGMPHRNAYNINWEFVVNYFKRLGYLVFQVGKRVGRIVAPHFNDANIETLIFLVREASVVIGIDSGVTQIAVSLDTPSVIFFGSVNPEKRYINFDKIKPLHSQCITKEDDFCYHNAEGSTTGAQCKYNAILPPCTSFSEWAVIDAVNKLLK